LARGGKIVLGCRREFHRVGDVRRD
jgi:hypothetical protein